MTKIDTEIIQLLRYKSEVEHFTGENVIEEFLKLCSARGRAVIAKMKEEATKVRLKKPRKLRRVEKNPTRKKLKVSEIKPEFDCGDHPMIQVKTESEG